MENSSTYVLKIVQHTFHGPFVGIGKFFLCIYNMWMETMDAFQYFPNLYCSLRSGCKRYPMSMFARVLNLWWRNFSGGSEPRIYLTVPSAISDGTVSPKLAIFPNLMGSCQGQSTSEHLEMVYSTNTIFVVNSIKFRIFCFRKIVSQR